MLQLKVVPLESTIPHDPSQCTSLKTDSNLHPQMDMQLIIRQFVFFDMQNTVSGFHGLQTIIQILFNNYLYSIQVSVYVDLLLAKWPERL